MNLYILLKQDMYYKIIFFGRNKLLFKNNEFTFTFDRNKVTY